MTKYEWETELKKNVHRLPKDEVKRILEYYGELFDDMAERGKSEREIIGEFGNPVDVADKIISEYDGELEPVTEVSVPPAKQSEIAQTAPEKTEEPKNESVIAEAPAPAPANTPEPANPTDKTKSKSITVENTDRRRADPARIVLFILFNVFTGGVIFIIIGVVWIVLASLAVAGGAIALAGSVAFLSSFVVMGTGNFGVALVQFGTSFALVGIGILLTIGCVYLIMLYIKLNKFLFGCLRKLLTVKEG